MTKADREETAQTVRHERDGQKFSVRGQTVLHHLLLRLLLLGQGIDRATRDRAGMSKQRQDWRLACLSEENVAVRATGVLCVCLSYRVRPQP